MAECSAMSVTQMLVLISSIWILMAISIFQKPTHVWMIGNYLQLKRGGNVSWTGYSTLPTQTTTKPLPPSSASASVPRLRITHPNVEETEGFLPTSCTCKTAPLRRSHIYEEQLSLPLPWFNVTSRQFLAKRHPNFPYSLVTNTSENWCHLMPPPHEIDWQNVYYQSVTVFNTSYYLYSAFLDNRRRTNGRPCIRILAFTTAKEPNTPWCYIWSNTTGPPAISQVIKIDYVDYQRKASDRVMFYILTCRTPEMHAPPLAVSIVRQPCDRARTLLQITGAMERNTSTAFAKGDNRETKSRTPLWNVAVCGPALFYYHEDISIRLVEWLELLRALGFARVFLLQTIVHPNIEKVLQYYEAEGFVGITHFSYPPPYATDPNIRR
ncbi:uncharacterized protein LOC122251934 [Penaeus japonicus]|uniref:uncharacterized protein LOC122251934 n=1 Tax=Penaeus japonicus TaxID=27405 RepID=UPI001C70CE74|nr:uncharacterized protein LOC122251934 [Penaeus japonicus]